MNKNIHNKSNFSFANKNTTRLFSSKFESFIVYNNSLLNKSNILKDNSGKSGIYRWVNSINNKCYIGSSVYLHSRLLNYNKNYLRRKKSTRNSHISRALLFHDYNNFNLETLEYCDINSVIDREQYYIYLLKPEYNI